MFIGLSSLAGTVAPSPSATLFARVLSTCASRNNIRSRMGGVSTLPSSKRKALMIWFFSGSVWLLKKSVAWLK